MEVGGYLENTVLFEHALLTAGARVDKFGNIDHGAFSPRVSVTIANRQPRDSRTFIRAFRSPSVVNNYLSTAIVQPVDLSGPVPAAAGCGQTALSQARSRWPCRPSAQAADRRQAQPSLTERTEADGGKSRTRATVNGQPRLAPRST